MEQIKAKHTPNIHSMLSKPEIILRSRMLDKLIDLNRPLDLREISLDVRDSNFDVASTLKTLTDKGLVASRKDGAITGVYPVSALPTPHKVQLKDGRALYSMCAIDALGMIYEFEQDVSISSSCKRCGKKISINSERAIVKRIDPPTTHAVHVDIEKYKNWAADCWNNMNFFCTEKHVNEWLKESNLNKDDIHVLDITSAIIVAKAIFGK